MGNFQLNHDSEKWLSMDYSGSGDRDYFSPPNKGQGLYLVYHHMGVSKNRGGPPKWMVKIMENPIKMDYLDYLVGFSHIFRNALW